LGESFCFSTHSNDVVIHTPHSREPDRETREQVMCVIRTCLQGTFVSVQSDISCPTMLYVSSTVTVFSIPPLFPSTPLEKMTGDWSRQQAPLPPHPQFFSGCVIKKVRVMWKWNLLWVSGFRNPVSVIPFTVASSTKWRIVKPEVSHE